MNAIELLREIQETFPEAMRVEIAAAFDLDERRVADLIVSSGMPKLPRKRQRPQSKLLICEIQQYADKRLGGKVEIIGLKCERPALCVDGRMIA